MDIKEFVSQYKNHPILFIGTGMSLRYLENSYSWDELLKKVSYELKGNTDYYYDIKSRCAVGSNFKYDKIATILEQEFNNVLEKDRNGKFKYINDIFYNNMEKNINYSRFKIYISELLKEISFKLSSTEEINALKRVRKNIGSIVTTNYDTLIESVFEFSPLIGNGILLSNPYGALYKIHGCVTQPDKIIISEEDYINFDKKYELIRAQLLSLFIHNPIIFMGYNIGDKNIKNILKTIFTYVEPNSEEAKKIRANFLLIEYEESSINTNVSEHDIDIEGFSTIRINKIKTDNYIEIYNALSLLQLPVSAMDIRKVQNVVKEIYSGGNIKVSITEDIDQLNNNDKVLVIGSNKTIKYTYQTTSEMMMNYFNIIDESNFQLLELIDKYVISGTQYFPIYGFAMINKNLECEQVLKEQQKKKMHEIILNMPIRLQTQHITIESILLDTNLAESNKQKVILFSILDKRLDNKDIENYLRNYVDKTSTDYRKLLCAYDYIRFGIV